jgi:ABC-type Mn2+/Zn2+ transport system permease subunit
MTNKNDMIRFAYVVNCVVCFMGGVFSSYYFDWPFVLIPIVFIWFFSQLTYLKFKDSIKNKD